MDHLLSLADIGKRYGQYVAISEISFDISLGEHLAVIGPNGAGKSTLFGVIAGEHSASSGSVTFVGSEITTWRPSKRANHGIARTFQTARMFGSLTVRQNMLIAIMGAGRSGTPWWRGFKESKESCSVIDELLVDANLAHAEDREAGLLAQGDRKSLELVMAVAQRPKLLLLDEPTAGMSHGDAALAIALVRKLQERLPDMAVVVTAHDMQVIFALADRVILMAQGRLMLDGTPREIAGHSLTKDIYLGHSAA
jgi:branched-chain amino acid transport system ATP-binding protein